MSRPLNPITVAGAKSFRFRPVASFKPMDDVGVGPWNKGLPPHKGWWPASCEKQRHVVRYFDGEGKMSQGYTVTYNPVTGRVPMRMSAPLPKLRWRMPAWDNDKRVKDLEKALIVPEADTPMVQQGDVHPGVVKTDGAVGVNGVDVQETAQAVIETTMEVSDHMEPRATRRLITRKDLIPASVGP